MPKTPVIRYTTTTITIIIVKIRVAVCIEIVVIIVTVRCSGQEGGNRGTGGGREWGIIIPGTIILLVRFNR